MGALLQMTPESYGVVARIKWTCNRWEIRHANFLQVLRGVNKTVVLHFGSPPVGYPHSQGCSLHSTFQQTIERTGGIQRADIPLRDLPYEPFHTSRQSTGATDRQFRNEGVRIL